MPSIRRPVATARRIAFVALAAVLVGLGGGVWLLAGPEPARSLPAIDPADPPQVARGARIYADHCAACHGAQLEGEPDWRERKPNGRLPAPPHDASGHTWHHPDAQLFRITKQGVAAMVPGYESDMPAFGPVLSDAEIAAVLAYIKSTWPDEIRERQAAISRQARDGE